MPSELLQPVGRRTGKGGKAWVRGDVLGRHGSRADAGRGRADCRRTGRFCLRPTWRRSKCRPWRCVRPRFIMPMSAWSAGTNRSPRRRNRAGMRWSIIGGPTSPERNGFWIAARLCKNTRNRGYGWPGWFGCTPLRAASPAGRINRLSLVRGTSWIQRASFGQRFQTGCALSCAGRTGTRSRRRAAAAGAFQRQPLC